MNRDDADLWKAKDRGSFAARDALALAYLPLVGITRRMRFPNVSPLFAEELEGEGRLALMRAIDEFDPSRGVAFKSYAITRIWGKMQEWCRTDDWVPRSEREKERSGEEAFIIQVEPLEDQEPAQAQEIGEDEIVAGIEADLLNRLVRYLPERERWVIREHVQCGHAVKTLAEERGESPITIRRIRDRALTRIRCWLDRTGAVSQ